MIDKILTMMSNWTPMGQGLFFLLILWIIISSLDKLCYYILVMFKGWPSSHYIEEEDQE